MNSDGLRAYLYKVTTNRLYIQCGGRMSAAARIVADRLVFEPNFPRRAYTVPDLKIDICQIVARRKLHTV